MDIFKSIIKVGDLVFDVGSNMGDKSEIFLSLGARVVGFEPQYNCFKQTVNRFMNNINFTSENLALDKKIGVETMYIANYHTISTMSKEFIDETKKERFTNYRWDETVKVNIEKLDNMIVKYGLPEFIKIDVEGYELNVLEGLTNPVKYISIEYTPELRKNAIECVEYIDKLNDNQTLFNYGYCNMSEFKYDEWISKDEIIKYLESIYDFKSEWGDVYCKNTQL